jgi:hypothetical protein
MLNVVLQTKILSFALNKTFLIPFTKFTLGFL